MPDLPAHTDEGERRKEQTDTQDEGGPTGLERVVPAAHMVDMVESG